MISFDFVEQKLYRRVAFKQNEALASLQNFVKNNKIELKKKQDGDANAKGIHLYNPFIKEIVFLEEVDICLVVEGTYPYVKGGVSSVVHQVIQSLPQYKFGILHVAWNEESPQKCLYQELPQIKWVHPYLLGSPMANHPLKVMGDVFEKNGLSKQKKFFTSSKRFGSIPSFSRRRKVREFIFNFYRLFSSQNKLCPKDFSAFYHKFLNPLRAREKAFKLINHSDFFHFLQRLPEFQKMTLEDLYWVRHEFTPIFQNLFFGIYPMAKSYHSHTTGYGGFVATLAGIQHEQPLLITEHSLYLADVHLQLQEQEKIHLDKLKEKFTESNRPDPESNIEELLEADLLKPQKAIKLDRFYHLKNYTIQKKYKLWGLWFAWMSKLTYAQAQKVSYLYSGLAQKAQQFSAPAERQVIIPNGIDEKIFGKVLLRRKELQAKGENAQKPFTLGLIGRVVPVKGILDFINAINILRQKTNTPFQVWIVGGAGEDKAYAQSCLDLCSELRLNDVIKFCGEQNMTEVLLSIDLVILSSHSEALPMVILEAMASGISVVSTRVGCVVDMLEKELVSDAGEPIAAGGLTVPRQNPELLALAVADLMNDPKRRALYEENGPKRVRQQYTMEKMREAYHRFYSGALE